MPPRHRLEQPNFPHVDESIEEKHVVASNDLAYGEPDRLGDRVLRSLSDQELYGKRKAHEIIQNLGFRKQHDREIDAAEIERVKQEMQHRGLTEETYQQFLRVRHADAN